MIIISAAPSQDSAWIAVGMIVWPKTRIDSLHFSKKAYKEKPTLVYIRVCAVTAVFIELLNFKMKLDQSLVTFYFTELVH